MRRLAPLANCTAGQAGLLVWRGGNVMEQNSRGERFMKITNILILAALVIITGLLASLHWKLSRGPAPEAPAVAAPQPAFPAPPAATPKPAEARPVPRRTVPAATPRHYTQAESELAPANPAAPREEPIPLVADATPRPALVTPPSTHPIIPAPPVPEPQPVVTTVPAGTILTVRLIDTVHSDRNRPGDRFTAALDDPIFAGGTVIVPRGSTVEGRVVDARPAGRVSGVSEIAVELDRLLLGSGESVELVTDIVSRQGEHTKGSDAAKIGAGAAIGAVIGAIGGGRKGAGVGAATGAGASTAGVLLTRGKPVILEPETRLSFQLRAPLQIEAVPAQSSYAGSDAPRYTIPRDPWDSERPRLRRQR